MGWGLVLTSGLALSAAAVLAHVAWGIRRRDCDPSLYAARDAHATGWTMLSIMAASDGLRVALALFGDPGHAGYLFLIYAKIVATSAAFAGFAIYVLTLWAGRTRLVGLVVALAVAHGSLFLLMTTARMPYEVVVGTWSTRLHLLGPGVGWLPQGAALLLFFLPTAAIGLAYLLLLPRLTDATHRLRVALVATAVITFQLAGTVQSNPSTDPDGLLVPGFTALLLLAALLSHLSYYPPGFLRRRFGIRSVADEGRTETLPAHTRLRPDKG